MRTAYIDVAAEAIPDCVRVLQDHGFAVLGTAASPPDFEGARFRIGAQHDADLPATCDAGPRLVTLLLRSEAYGRQRFTRITDLLDSGPVQP